MAAGNNRVVVHSIDELRNHFERLTADHTSPTLLENLKFYQNWIQQSISEDRFQKDLKEVTKVLPTDEEPSKVRLRQIIGIVGLMCVKAAEFAKNTAGYTGIPSSMINQDAQIILIKPFIREMIFLWMGSCYNNESDSIVLPDQNQYSCWSFTIAGFESFANDLLDLARAMHDLKINTTELAYLYVLSLYNEERQLLKPIAKEAAKFWREAYIDSFEEYMKTEHQSNERIVELLRILPKAQSIAAKCYATLNQSHKDKCGSLLFQEIWYVQP